MSGFQYIAGVEAVPGYRLIEVLGRGGFGEVWKAEGPGRITVAVKIIDKVDEKAGRKEFRALNLIKDLRHPNLVSISGFWLRDSEGNLLDPDLLSEDSAAEETGKAGSDKPSELIIAMDLGEMSLLDRLKECREKVEGQATAGIPLDELLDYMEAAARAIDYLNTRHDIQHRDVKPQNILIVGGSAQVCDFGLASTISSVRTSMGGAGSLAYMAPEVYTTKHASRATDQYGLAIAFVELRTGHLPLSDVESYSVLDDAKRKGTLDLSRLEATERTVIAQAAALDPDDRFASCIEMVRAMRQAIVGGATTIAPATRAETLGDYQPEKRLSTRGGEEIWIATGPEGHRVSLVVRDLDQMPDTIRRTVLPAVREASKNHPHLAELYEYVRLNADGQVLPSRLFEGPNAPPCDKLLLAGRLIGENLADAMGSGGIAPRQLLQSMEQLAGAVDYLNEPQHGVDGMSVEGKQVSLVHGNLRPINFQTEAGQTLLGNFASVQSLEGDEQEFPAGEQSGDGPYTPPEVAAGRLSRQTDQYQLAVAYLQMRTGKPSSGLTATAANEGRLDYSGLEEAERDVLVKATANEPSDRYENCVAMVAALSSAWESAQPDEPDPPPTSPPTSPSAAHLTAGPAAGDASATMATPAAQTGSSISATIDSPGQTTEQIGTEQIGTEQIDRASQVQGTLMPPALGETLVHGDTDPGHNRPSTPSLLAEPAATEPIAGRPLWRHPALIGAVLLVLAAAGVVPFMMSTDDQTQTDGGPGGDHQNQATGPDNSIDRLLKQSQFEQALAEMNDEKRSIGSTLDKQRQEEAILLQWYSHAQNKLNKADYNGALVSLNGLLSQRFPYQDAMKLRSEAIRQLILQAEGKLGSQLASSAGDAHALLNSVIKTIDSVAHLDEIASSDKVHRSMALLHRARASMRLRRPKAAAEDLAAITEPFETARNRADFEALSALVREAEFSTAQVRDILTAHASSMTKWERGELDNLLKRIEADEGSEHFKQYKALIAQADEKIDSKKIDEAAKILNQIENDKNLLAVAKSLGMSDFEEVTALVLLLGEGRSKTDLERGVSLARKRIVVGTPHQNRLPNLCIALAARATQMAPAGDHRQWPELLAAALDIVTAAKAKSTGAGAGKEIGLLLTDLGIAYQDDIRRQRDRAGSDRKDPDDTAGYTKLRDQSERAKGWNVESPLSRAAWAESLVELREEAALAAKLSSQLSSAETDVRDQPYLHYVTALGLAASDKFDAAADQLIGAWQPPSGAKDSTASKQQHSLWQASPRRQGRVIRILAKAAEGEMTGSEKKLGTEDRSGDRFTPQAAARVFSWLSLAGRLLPTSNLDAKHRADVRTTDSIRLNSALSAAYGEKTGDLGLTLTDQLIQQQGKDLESIQLLVVNLRLHRAAFAQNKETRHRDLMLRRYAQLLQLSEIDGPTSETIYHQVVAPGSELATSLLPELKGKTPQPDLSTRQAAAMLAASRGRYIRMFPVVERLFIKEDPAREIFDAYHTAVRLDPLQVQHHVGYSLAAYSRLDLKAAEKVTILEKAAAEAERLATTEYDKSLASGLRGLTLYQQSIGSPVYKFKIEKLSAALNQFKAAGQRADKAYQDSEDYQSFLFIEGTAYLHLANYVLSQSSKRDYLSKAVKLAEEITTDYQFRRHPEKAFQLWGNAEEDHGLFLGELEGYLRGIDKFDRAYQQAQLHKDEKGMSIALVNRGRSRFRHVTATLESDLNKTLNSDETAKRRRWAVTQFNSAINDLERSIDVAGAWPLKQAEAHRWIGSIYQQPLSENFKDATEHFRTAAELAKPGNPSWPYYELQRASNAMHFARKLVDPDQPNLARAKQILGEATAAAEPLLAAKADPRVASRHRLAAALVLAQRALWLRRPQEATDIHDSAAEQIDPSDRFQLALGTAEKVLDLPGKAKLQRRLTASEVTLARHTLTAAMAASKPLSGKQLRQLFQLNDKYYKYWKTHLDPAFKQFVKDKSNKQDLLEMVRNSVFHLDIGTRLQADPGWKQSGLKADPQWRAALDNYRQFLTSQ